MDKFNVPHPNNGIFGNKKKWRDLPHTLLKARRVISSSPRATCKNSAMVPDLTTSAQTSMVSPGKTASIHTTSFSFSTQGI